MGDSTITVQGVVLAEHWPGVPIDPPVSHTDMTTAAVGHNIANPMFRLGQKWKVYCSGDEAYAGVGYNLGWSTFIYLKCEAGIETAIAAIATSICVVDDTMAAGDAATKLYTKTADSANTTHDALGLIGVALSTMTNDYYGWFWCGGVCPIEYVPLFTTASTLVTDDSVLAGSELAVKAATSTGIALEAQDSDATEVPVGYSLYADGT